MISVKIRQFLDYLQYEKRYSEHTIMAYKRDLTQFADYIHHQYEVSTPAEISHLYIRSWMVDLVENNIGARSINRKLSSIKSFFKFCLKRSYISSDPMTKIVRPKTGKRLPSVVSEKSFNDLFHLFQSMKDSYETVRDKAMITLLYMTGIRRSELINLLVADIDFSQGTLRVLGKGKKERIVPLTPELIKVFKDYLQVKDQSFDFNSSYLFLTNKGKPLYPKLVYLIVKKYLALVSSIEQKSPHVIRHSFATHLSNNGAELNAVKELLGHANLAATQIYTHNTIDRLKSIYQKAHPKGDKKE